MQTLEVGDHKRDLIRKRSFKPLLEDALQVLKSPLHNPEAKDFKNIMYVMKNCYLFRKMFSSQVALNEFVDFAKFYVGYEVHKYGSVLLHDKEYADKLCIILDGTVEKIFQKPYGEIEGQIQDKRRRVSCLGFETLGSFLHFQAPRKGSEGQQITLKVPDSRHETGKTFLPSLHDNIHILKKSESCISDGDNSDTSGTANSITSIKKTSSPRANSINQINKVQRHRSQQCVFQKPPTPAEYSNVFEDLISVISNKNPEVRKKYFTEGILRAEKVKTFTTGEYFGETFCLPNHPKSNFMYAVSSPEAHLLTLRREDYDEIMKQLERKNHEKLQAFLNLFPSFEKEYVQRFSYHFSQKHFEVDEVIYFQGSPAQDLYILQSGGVQLLRNQDSPKDLKGALLPIISIVKDQAFGEESLLMMNSRQETAVSNVFNTTAFILSALLLHELQEEFGSLLDDLQTRAQEKFHWRQKKAKELFAAEETHPVDSSPKNYLPLLPLRDIGEVQSLFKPRQSIHVPYHRAFLSEKSPTHSPISAISRLLDPHSPTSPFSRLLDSPSMNCLTSSPSFNRSSIKLRKLSDDEAHQNPKANEIYKAQFGRVSVIPENLKTIVVHEKRNSLKLSQVHDISPGSDLKTMNFRKELYGDTVDSKQLGRFGQAVRDNLSPNRQRRKIIIRKQEGNCDLKMSSPRNKQLSLEKKMKPRASIKIIDYLPTCKILKGLNKIDVHWN